MPGISEQTWKEALTFRDGLREAVKATTSIEAMAQTLVEMIYDEYSESIVLVRCFVTLPFDGLPSENQAFIRKLAVSKGCADEITATTPVLTLMGSRGVRYAWNDRRQSKGHIGIPLISTTFIDSIPMIARVLKELDVNIEWLKNQEVDGVVEKQAEGGWVGIFYVREAKTAVDQRGRSIISAQDFVAEHSIGTVFGVGGIYTQGTIFTLIVFTRDTIEKASIEGFTPIVQLIRANTSHLVRDNRIFA